MKNKQISELHQVNSSQPLVPAVSQMKTVSFLPQKEVTFGMQHKNQNKTQASFRDMILILGSH